MDYKEYKWHHLWWELFTNWEFFFSKFNNFTPYKTETKDEKNFSKWRTTRWYQIERKERVYENVIKCLKTLQKLWYQLVDKIENVDKRPRDMLHKTEIRWKKSGMVFSFVWNLEYDLQKNLYTFLWKLVIENENVIPTLFDKK